uniref:testis-expressed protein 264-like n=1 Tax=Callithrix jacchus TaxID=9483 RepID=UPI0023DD2D7D|nr:testis-expressed protein 264-like [Callithrix jacchus]
MSYRGRTWTFLRGFLALGFSNLAQFAEWVSGLADACLKCCIGGAQILTAGLAERACSIHPSVSLAASFPVAQGLAGGGHSGSSPLPSPRPGSGRASLLPISGNPEPTGEEEWKLCAHPRLEIYQQDQIHFMCPLARQGDFYVPEAKETEQKWRGLAEAIDAQVDGTGADMMSDTMSSVSLEVSPGSRETSIATLSPGASSRGWDDGDTRSEHSYSESGASGSSFEELDLEGEGLLGEPQLDPETEPLGTTKWPWQPSTPEKGKE